MKRNKNKAKEQQINEVAEMLSRNAELETSGTSAVKEEDKFSQQEVLYQTIFENSPN